MNTLSLLHGLRFVDSLFPSGGYAYSSGLEAAVQGNAVRDAGDLNRYVADLLRRSLGPREGVAVGRAHRAVRMDSLDDACAVDRELESMKLSREARAASRQMGRHVIRIAGEGADAVGFLREFRTAVEARRTPGHLPVCIGITLGSHGWAACDAVGAFLYHAAAGFMSAALKLLPIGQQEGQRLLEGWLPIIDGAAKQAMRDTDMHGWSPLQDIHAMRHARLTVRLFRS